MFYAAHNAYADLNNGNQGFLNSWEVSRFATHKDRDAFVCVMENKNSKAVTRKEAVAIWRSCYLSVGENIPRGGLFADSRYSDSRFWNENQF